MKNSIKVTIPFSFKGKEYSPSSVIDLDIFIKGDQTLDNVFQLVANENKIDNYSYEYEVLESATKIFSDPTGSAVDYLSDVSFDLEGFKNHSKMGEALEKLQEIAQSVLDIDDLSSNTSLQEALLQAYQAGANDNK